jgi:hypothetical protein
VALLAGLIAVTSVASMAFVDRAPARIQAAGLFGAPAPVAPLTTSTSTNLTSPSPSPSPADPNVPRYEAFARAGGVTLYLPAADPVAVTYHEASFEDAMALHPLGHIVRNANRWKFESPPRTPGPDYMVMSSRGRGTPATSATDVILRPHTAFRAPVTGTIVEVDEYHLYCRYPDYRVRIQPEGGTKNTVVMIHLKQLQVRPGDHVFATLSVIGYPRPFPFRSQVDDYVLGGYPHVHIEITRPHPPRTTC